MQASQGFKYRPIKNNKGQTLIEYLIIVVLIGIGSIVAVTKLRQKLNTKFNQVTASLNKVSPSNSKNKSEKENEENGSSDTNPSLGSSLESSLGDWLKDQISK
jgi:Flp pilus assembly pilin Flp